MQIYLDSSSWDAAFLLTAELYFRPSLNQINQTESNQQLNTKKKKKKISKWVACYIVEMKISHITPLSARRLCAIWSIIDFYHLVFINIFCLCLIDALEIFFIYIYYMWKTLQLFTTHVSMGKHHSLVVTKVTFVFAWLLERGSSDTILKWQKMCFMRWNESLTKTGSERKLYFLPRQLDALLKDYSVTLSVTLFLKSPPLF